MTSNRESVFTLRPWMFAAATFVTMLVLSWHRWTSLIVDNGRETDMPLRLMNGEWLYRDVHFLYTPFSPYFNALLYRIFGPHLDTLSFSGIVWSILLSLLCYRIFIKLMPPVETTLAVCIVIVLCIFKPTGNLVVPYSFAALHGMVFSIAALLFLMRFAEKKKAIDLAVCGLFIGLTSIAKQEFAFAGVLAVTAYLIFLHRTNVVRFARDIAIAGIPAMLIFVPVMAVLFAKMDVRMLIDDCHLFYTNIPASLVYYNRFRSGLNFPLWSIFQILGSAGVCAAIVFALIFFSDRKGKLKRLSAVGFVASAIFALTVGFLSISQWDGSPIRALPLVLIGIIFIAWRRKSGEDNSSNAFLFITAAYALAVIIRVILRVPSGGFSGSFFLPVGLCLIFYTLLWELPRYIQKWTDDENSFLRAQTITRVLCGLIIVATMISFGYRFRTKFADPISAQRGDVYVEKESGPVIAETLRFIEANTAPNDIISVMPEGNDLAFLTGRRINLRHQVLLPDFLSQQDELDAIDDLKRGNVRYIFVPNRAMREFGHVAFGKDFYQTLGGWIEENYRVVKIFGIPDGQSAEIGDAGFFIKVYERKE